MIALETLKAAAADASVLLVIDDVCNLQLTTYNLQLTRRCCS